MLHSTLRNTYRFKVPRYKEVFQMGGWRFWLETAAKVALGVNKNAMWMTMAVRGITSWTRHIAHGHETGPEMN